MRLTLSDARKNLGHAVTHVQDPNNFVILFRHGKAVAGIVSMPNLKRIWQQQDEQDKGEIWHPLYHIRHSRHRVWTPGEIGRGGKIVSKREAALQLRTLQLNRADERRILRTFSYHHPVYLPQGVAAVADAPPPLRGTAALERGPS